MATKLSKKERIKAKKAAAKAKKASPKKSAVPEREYHSMECEEPLPDKWWAEVPSVDERTHEDLLCEVSRLIRGYLGTPIRSVKRLMYAEDVYRLLAERERLIRDNKKLTKKVKRLQRGTQ